MKNSQRNIIVKRALIAVAEARIQARINSGDAANVHPTEKQALDIFAAEALNVSDEEARQAGKELIEGGIFPVMLYASEGGYDFKDILREIKEAIYI
jgi:hypothetical protein